ncbi:MAG: VRR-NUC domain-containing protein [Gammaproteobacteria bacterium]|nr:VRR-NUC domain-containing protein [Gammaproteobacteria bacterium]
MPDDLPEGYYLDNFTFLLDFVSRQYCHLLSEQEKQFYSTFQALTLDSRKLFVRLTNRKGPYFRLDKLNYPEVESLGDEIESLVAASLIVPTVPDLESAIRICSKAELLDLDACSEFPQSTKKQDLAEYLLSGQVNPVQALMIPVVELARTEELTVFKLLFFGNFHQDMTTFVMHELVAPFEQYEIDGNAALFRCREVIDELIVLRSLSDASYKLMETEGSEEDLLKLIEKLPARNIEPVLSRRYDRMVNQIGRHLERAGRIEEAVGVYCRAQATPARERQARILDRLGKPQAAMKLCSSIIEAPQNEEELEFAQTFGQRLSSKHGFASDVSFNLPVTKIKQTTIQVSRSHNSVEMCALAYFEDLGDECYYVENSLIRSLFGLCFWDIIYAPVSGAFFNPFQRGPVDLYTSDFVRSRRVLISDRFNELEKNGPLGLATAIYREKQGVANPFVNWMSVDEQLMETALVKIPSQDLIRMFERLLIDLKNNSSGFPDLIVFDQNSYRMIEIKGPGDKLQKNQARWFRYFMEHSIPAALVNVEYLDPVSP